MYDLSSQNLWGSFVSGKWISLVPSHLINANPSTFDVSFNPRISIESWETDIFSPYPHLIYNPNAYAGYVPTWRGRFGGGILADIAAENRIDWTEPQMPGARGASALSDDVEWTDMMVAAANQAISFTPGAIPGYGWSSGGVRDFRNVFGGSQNDFLSHALEGPLVPVCMLKRRANNPYFTVDGSDVSGTGFELDVPHSYPSPGYPGYSPLYAPNANTDMPLHSASMPSGGLVVSLEYKNGITVPESALVPPSGYLDSYTDVPGNLWVRLAFSSDGEGTDATSFLTKVDLEDTNGNFIPLEIAVDAGTIGGNEYIDEIDIYWRRPHAYFAKNPFPTDITQTINVGGNSFQKWILSVPPWHVIMRGLTSIREFKVNTA